MFSTYFYVNIFQQNFKAMEDKFRKVRTVDEFGNVKYIPAHLAESCAATYNLVIEDLPLKDEIRTLDEIKPDAFQRISLLENNIHEEEETIIEGLQPIAETTVKTKTYPAKKK